jgi:hypothetical protein
MLRRAVTESALEQVIEQGFIKHHDSTHYWVFDHVMGRSDNMICAAVLEKDALIVKTVMINWELEE